MDRKWKLALIISIFIFFIVTGQAAQACYWNLDKQTLPPDLTSLTLMPGQTQVVNFKVTVISSLSPINANSQLGGGCSASVYDTFGNLPTAFLGYVNYPVDLDIPKEFTYSQNIRFDECGDYQVTNVASLYQEWGITDSLSLNVHVPCEGGCTLTPGYWKTHSKYGPAPYDNTWALVLPNGEDKPFFNSGQSWYQVLWSPPAGGNAYYILAHAYIAAYMNGQNGASSTAEVDAAKTWAEDFFTTYTPSSRLRKVLRNEAIGFASILDQYNNGITGPGHCSE